MKKCHKMILLPVNFNYIAFISIHNISVYMYLFFYVYVIIENEA